MGGSDVPKSVLVSLATVDGFSLLKAQVARSLASVSLSGPSLAVKRPVYPSQEHRLGLEQECLQTRRFMFADGGNYTFVYGLSSD